MRLLVAITLNVAAWALAASAALPVSISYQGSLKDSGGQPVDGSRSLRISLYDQPTGGTQLWTETQSVSVAAGLFTVPLGGVTPFGDLWSQHDGYYLEIEVMGAGGFEVLMPRQRLVSVPFAMEAGSLHGDAETEPGKIKVEFGAGVPTTSVGHAELSSSADGSGLSFTDSSTSTGMRATGVIKGIGTGGNGSTILVESIIDGDVAGFEVQTAFDDGGPLQRAGSRGEPAGRARHSSSAIEPRSALKTYFESGDVPTQSDFSSLVDASGARWSLGASDLDRDGNVDVRCSPDSVTELAEVTDGSSSSSYNMRTRINQLETVLKSTGLLETARVSSTAGSGASITVEDSSHSTAERAKGTIKGGGMGTGGATLTLESDADGDGTPEVTYRGGAMKERAEADMAKKSPTHQSSVLTTCDDSAMVQMLDSSLTSGARARGIIVVKGATGTASASQHLSVDPDGDGTVDASVSLECDENRGSIRVAQREQQEANAARIQAGNGSSSVSLGDAATDAHIELLSAEGPQPGGDPSSTFRMGRPALNEGIFVCDASGTTWTARSSLRYVQVSNSDASAGLVMVETALGTEDTSIVIDGDAKRFGIGVSEPVHPIHHSSGAHLSAAGDWINASDVNLKENFTALDGADLLQRVEALNITQWNYRDQSADVKHIGPTAQEFKQIFGVGGNDETISTIDPSGIALAAIQELARQNRALQEQNRSLAAEMANLKRKLEKLEAR